MDTAAVARVAIAPIAFASIWRHSFGPVADQSSVDPETFFKTTLDVLFGGISAQPVPAVRA